MVLVNALSTLDDNSVAFVSYFISWVKIVRNEGKSVFIL